VDGCGVVAFAIPLGRTALAYSRLEQLDGGERVATAMRAHPVLVGGDGATDTTLMQQQPDVFAKGGAEGLFCASGLGLGLALKVADGNPRALRPALAVLGEQLGLALEAFAAVPVRNRHGEEAAVVSVL
jgi:L-asparaginase II